MRYLDFKGRKYNAIYGSWATGYLEDDDVITLLTKARASLVTKKCHKPGMIVLKETTITQANPDKFDSEQQIILRTKEELMQLFERAKYKVVYTTETQMTFGEESPTECDMYCIIPILT